MYERISRLNKRHSDDRAEDQGSVLIMTLMLMVFSSLIAIALLNYATTLFRARPPLEERNTATETTKGAMRMAMMLQRDIGPESCFDPVANFQMNGMDVSIECVELANTATETNYYETGRSRLSVITTYSGLVDGPSVKNAFSAEGLGAAKAIDGDVFISGGTLDDKTSDISFGGVQAPTVRFSNAPLAGGPPDTDRYTVAGTPIGCTTGDTSSLGATYANSGSYECTDLPWWEFAGNDYDESDGVTDRTYPLLPELPSYTRSRFGVDIDNAIGLAPGQQCIAYFPGRYNASVVLDGDGPVGTSDVIYYFASGVYYFTEPLVIRDGAQVVMGQGRHDGCSFDAEAVFDPDAPKNHEITGEGATLLFGGNAMLDVDDASLKINLRISSPTTRGTESMSIRSVNGPAVSAANVGFVDIPEDRVQVGEYPNIVDGAGDPVLDVNGNPQPDPTNLSNAELVGTYRFQLDGSSADIPFETSTLSWNDNIIDVRLRGANADSNEFIVDGNIFTPNARIGIDTGTTTSYRMNVSGGLVASSAELKIQAMPADNSWFAGVTREWVQRRVQLNIEVDQPEGGSVDSTAFFQVHNDRSYAVNAWSIDAKPGSSSGSGGATTTTTTTVPTGPTTTTTTTVPTGPTTTTTTTVPANDGPTHPTMTGDSGQPIGNFPENDYCDVTQTSYTNDFGGGSWLREWWHFTSSADYTNDDLFSGSPVGSNYVAEAKDNWSNTTGPESQINYFSVRYTATINIPVNCEFRIQAGGDDGYRLYVDGAVAVEDWARHGYRDTDNTVDLGPGEHLIVMEFYEWTGQARAEVSWKVI